MDILLLEAQDHLHQIEQAKAENAVTLRRTTNPELGSPSVSDSRGVLGRPFMFSQCLGLKRAVLEASQEPDGSSS